MDKIDLRAYSQKEIDEKYNQVLEMVRNGEQIKSAIKKANIGDKTFYKRISPSQLAELKFEKNLNTKYSFRKLY
jgi:hypothetical protein